MEKIPLILFMFYTVPASIIPLIVGLIILVISRRDKLVVLASFLTLKPVVEGFISFLMMSNGIGYSYGIAGVIAFGMLPPVVISFFLLFVFQRTVNRGGKISLILFGLDAIRWLISSVFPWWFGISSEGFISIWYLALCFQVIFPSVYAVITLAIVINRKMIRSKSRHMVTNA